MKKLLGLSIILLSTVAFVACSDSLDDKPEKVYRTTIENPELGGNTSLGSTTPPIADGIGTSLDLFSGNNTKKSLKTPQNLQKTAGAAQVEVTEEPTITQKQIEQAEKNSAAGFDVNSGEGAEGKLTRAPRIPAEAPAANEPAAGEEAVAETEPLITIEDDNYEQLAASEQKVAPKEVVIAEDTDSKAESTKLTEAPVAAPASAPAAEPVKVAEKVAPKEEPVFDNSEELVTTPVSPDSGIQITSLTREEAEQKARVVNNEPTFTELAPAVTPVKQEVKEVKKVEAEEKVEIASVPTELAPAKTKAAAAMPASLFYKMNQQATAPAQTATVESRAVESSEVETKISEAPVQETRFEVEGTSELPPVTEANVGQCMAKAVVFGEYKEIEENIVTKEASERTVQIPAEYKEVEEEVVVKEASTKLVEIPATYKTVEEEVVISAEQTKEIVTPAKYNTVNERVLVSPAQKAWRKQGGSEIMQLVEEPAVYKNVSKQVVVEEEKRNTQTIPAVTKIVKKQVVDQAARVEKQSVPAITKKITKQVLVSDATTQTVKIPAEFRTVKKQVPVSPDKEQWMPVLCKDNTTRETVKRLQGALIARGYDIKAADGVIGKETETRVDAYQKSLGFKSAGIALKTLETLGVQNQ